MLDGDWLDDPVQAANRCEVMSAVTCHGQDTVLPRSFLSSGSYSLSTPLSKILPGDLRATECAVDTSHLGPQSLMCFSVL